MLPKFQYNYFQFLLEMWNGCLKRIDKFKKELLLWGRNILYSKRKGKQYYCKRKESIMRLLMAVIDNPSKVVHILEGFLQIGIKGSTIIDSIGMAHLAADHIPVFSQYAALGGSERYNKTIFAVINKDEHLTGAIEVIQHIVGDLSKPDTGVVFVIPVEKCIGLNKEYHKKS